MKDTLLRELVKKKKSLLDDLLVLSIRSVCDIEQEEVDIIRRSDLLTMLEVNDQAISTREKQTGIKATGQEKELLTDIGILLNSIKENNQAALLKLEVAEKTYEKERSRLGMGKKLSRYVAQNNTIHHYRKKSPLHKAAPKRLKGQL